MTLIIGLLGALAWPLASVGIALMFRQDLKLALGRLGRVKFRDVEVNFRDDLRQAEALARSIPTTGRVVLELGSGDSAPAIGGEIIGGSGVPVVGGLDRLASRSPREAILEAWSSVGQALRSAASKLGDRRGLAPGSAEDAARFLIDRGWLAGPEAQLVDKLRLLRDRVAHLDEIAPTPEEARRYVEMAGPIAAKVGAIG